MAKTIEAYEEKIPAYAVSYIINGDLSGLEKSDKKAIDNFMDFFYNRAKILKGHVVIDIGEGESYFSSRPAFGLACDVVDAKILIIK